jgi:Ca2+/H+ antiporter
MSLHFHDHWWLISFSCSLRFNSTFTHFAANWHGPVHTKKIIICVLVRYLVPLFEGVTFLNPLNHSLTHSLARSFMSVISYALFMYFPIIICSFITENSQQGPIERVEQLLENFPIFDRAYNNAPTGPVSLRSALILSSLLCVSIVSSIVSLYLQTLN